MTKTSRHYHRLTAYDRHRMTPHPMNWAAQPRQFKSYSDLPAVTLPEISSLFPGEWDVVSSGSVTDDRPAPPDMEDLSRIFYLANGLTGRSRHQGGYFYYRSPPSAGALYPNELYLAWFGSDDLTAGLYHYEPHQRQLTRLRDGDFRAFMPEAEDSHGVFLISGIFFRSAWKYRNRAYRYVLLDGGHLVESARLALVAAGQPGALFYDFDDHQINRLLGVDPDREVGLAGIRIGRGSAPSPLSISALDELPLRIAAASRVSETETAYEEIAVAHRSGETVLPVPVDVPDIQAPDLGLAIDQWRPFLFSFDPGNDPIRFGYAQAVIRRRSRRNFIPEPVSTGQFACLLEMICRACLTGEQEVPAVSKTVQTGFLCWNVDDIRPGFYLLNPASRQFGSVAAMDLIPSMTAACLNQEWLKNAAVHFLFMTNLDTIDRRLGPRGYRYAMMTAGRLGHAVYLAATAMGLGCCGIGAFYDNEAEQLLGLNGSSALLYLAAVGQIK
ncbi:MAG: SagB/ThcOx family dehydrogenase [Thermodesulfobacteriota bacterium]